MSHSGTGLSNVSFSLLLGILSMLATRVVHRFLMAVATHKGRCVKEKFAISLNLINKCCVCHKFGKC